MSVELSTGAGVPNTEPAGLAGTFSFGSSSPHAVNVNRTVPQNSSARMRLMEDFGMGSGMTSLCPPHPGLKPAFASSPIG